MSSHVLGTCPINSLMASASRMGIVPPLFNDVMAMTRLVRPVNKKLQNFTAQKYGTQMDDRQLLTNSLHTCGYPRVLCFILNPILLNRERNFVLVGGMDLTAATFRLQYANDYEYEFSVLSTHFYKFERRKFSKCARSELETRTRRLPI